MAVTSNFVYRRVSRSGLSIATLLMTNSECPYPKMSLTNYGSQIPCLDIMTFDMVLNEKLSKLTASKNIGFISKIEAVPVDDTYFKNVKCFFVDPKSQKVKFAYTEETTETMKKKLNYVYNICRQRGKVANFEDFKNNFLRETGRADFSISNEVLPCGSKNYNYYANCSVTSNGFSSNDAWLVAREEAMNDLYNDGIRDVIPYPQFQQAVRETLIEIEPLIKIGQVESESGSER